MPELLDKAVLEDELAVSLARGVAAANERARREGLDLNRSLLSATEYVETGEICWRISYIPRDYLQRRGGDLIIEVGRRDAQVRRVMRGQ